MKKIYSLTVLLAILKLAGLITWPWGWVFSPIWIEAIALLGFVIICAAFVTNRVKNENVAVWEMPLLGTGEDQADIDINNQDQELTMN